MVRIKFPICSFGICQKKTAWLGSWWKINWSASNAPMICIWWFQEWNVDENKNFSDVSNHQKWQRWLSCGGMMQLCKAGVYCKPSRRIRKPRWICGVEQTIQTCYFGAQPQSFELLSEWLLRACYFWTQPTYLGRWYSAPCNIGGHWRPMP